MVVVCLFVCFFGYCLVVVVFCCCFFCFFVVFFFWGGGGCVFLFMGCIEWQEKYLPQSDHRKGNKTGSHPRWPLMILKQRKSHRVFLV